MQYTHTQRNEWHSREKSSLESWLGAAKDNGREKLRKAIVAPFASLYPGIGISNHPYKANRPLRDDEFKGADIAKGSTPANIHQAFA